MANEEQMIAHYRSLLASRAALLDFAKEFDEACSIKAAQGSKAVLGITELNRLWEMARGAISKAEPA